VLKISVLVDKAPRRYRVLGNKLMRGFFITYFDIRDKISSRASFDEFILWSILSNGRFVGEDLPNEVAEEVINYLEEFSEDRIELHEHVLYIVSDGQAFLEFFEKKLSEVLRSEYESLLARLRGF